MSGLGKVTGLAGRSGIDPQDLDDTTAEVQGQEVEHSYALKELFWDKIVIFLTSAIVALTAVDILTELLRGGSGVVCFVSEELNLTEGQEDYVNSYCAQSVPDTQYLPIFVLVHGVLIATWHYLWKSSFTSHFDFFFSLAQTLTRLDDETTGEYPHKNLNIIKKLEIEFSTFNRSRILWWYRAKLGAQLLTAIASMFSAFLIFTDFDVNFFCPRIGIDSQHWPIPGERINCIFTSLRLFSLVRVVDIFLLSLIILAVLWGLVWSISRHTVELGYANVALFSFTSGISPEYFVPKPMFRHIRGFFRNVCSARMGHEIVLRFFSPRIKTDLDFLLMMLYRTDSGLGHSFKEGQVHRERKRLSDADLLRLNVHIRTGGNSSMAEEDEKENQKLERVNVERVSLKWRFQHGVYTSFAPTDHAAILRIPDVMQGAILGYGLCAPNNDRAVDISFGSQGFSFALARAFKLVGSINFDPSYKDSENPIVQVKYPVNLTAYHCREDILSQDARTLRQFAEQVDKLWSYCGKRNYYKTGYAVIGPIDQRGHLNTVNLLLQQLKVKFAENAVLLIVRPIKIEGKTTTKQFFKFVPPKELFTPLHQNVETVSGSLLWPARQVPTETHITSTAKSRGPSSNPQGATVPSSSQYHGASFSSVRNIMRQTFGLECGNSLCDFELTPYKFTWKPPTPPRDTEDEQTSSESEKEDEDAESDENSNGSSATGEAMGGKGDKQLLLKGVSEAEWKPEVENVDVNVNVKEVNSRYEGAEGSGTVPQTSIKQNDLETLRYNQDQY